MNYIGNLYYISYHFNEAFYYITHYKKNCYCGYEILFDKDFNFKLKKESENLIDPIAEQEYLIKTNLDKKDLNNFIENYISNFIFK